MKPKVAILIPEPMASKTLSEKDKKRLAKFAQIKAGNFSTAKPEIIKGLIVGADGCITGWGSCKLTEDILEAAPRLKIIVHAAGSVKGIVSEMVWERKIKVTSAASAIAVGVAEHTLGLMLSALKRDYWFNEIIHQGGWRDEGEVKRVKELYGITIGVVGASHVGRHFIKLLQNFEVEILLYDPFISKEEAQKIGTTKVEKLEDLISRVDVLSIHAPSLPKTHHMLNRDNLRLMKDGALLINTARGALIDEEALSDELKSGRLTACLDVTDPEPPATDNPLRRLSNVVFTPHIAGAVANNIFRQGSLAVTELERFFSGKSLLYPVTRQDISRIA